MTNVEVRYSKKIKERGVFALKDFNVGEVIEVSPIILLPMEDQVSIEKTKLRLYYFDLTDTHFAIVLGYGSLYNHSYNSNARYNLSIKRKTMEIKAILPIKKGEEIFINYNWDPKDKTSLSDWFDPEFKDLSHKT
jgi:SET domain-containing protein